MYVIGPSPAMLAVVESWATVWRGVRSAVGDDVSLGGRLTAQWSMVSCSGS